MKKIKITPILFIYFLFTAGILALFLSLCFRGRKFSGGYCI